MTRRGASLRPGDMLSIQGPDNVLRTKVLEVAGEDVFETYPPGYRVGALSPGDAVGFTLYRPEGLYRFEGSFQGYVQREGLRACRFRVSSPLRRIQRRETYRLETVLGVTLHDLETPGEIGAKGMQGTALNLSQGGLLVRLAQPLQPGQRMRVALLLEGGQPWLCVGEVVRCGPAPGREGAYHAALRFEGMQGYGASGLARYILRQQVLGRRLRREEGE